jgi:hypothetical protein
MGNNLSLQIFTPEVFTLAIYANIFSFYSPVLLAIPYHLYVTASATAI